MHFHQHERHFFLRAHNLFAISKHEDMSRLKQEGDGRKGEKEKGERVEEGIWRWVNKIQGGKK
jgi:hypothetical protein